ncbi:AraC-like DNA-binding protein [Marinobacterium halophilum]|uniref:AraC-like DNA-binding protein n=1 Tax=Marinobacterium halophilum TaxID=267374 RepID=A0A2P8EYU2_9GAMM|nr:AraC-like DNA-binding protein [Marinobacterium halophilum]
MRPHICASQTALGPAIGVRLVIHISKGVRVNTATTFEQRFMTSDFEAIGRKYAIRYDFPEARPSRSQPVLHGQLSEYTLDSGLRLTFSNVRVITTYESRSTGEAALFVCLLLKGKLRFRIHDQVFNLEPGMALDMSLHSGQPVEVSHPAGQQLHTMTLVWPGRSTTPHTLLEQLVPFETERAPALWRLPSGFHQQLCQLDPAPAQTLAQKLLIEGVALQIVGYSFKHMPANRTHSRVSSAEAARLYELHDLITVYPEQPYTVQSMAEQVAMSSSRLRHKFRLQFSENLFDFIRRQRLTKAHGLVLAGYSIEHTAHSCGYAHTSNFTTAFKRHFGYSPGKLMRQC